MNYKKRTYKKCNYINYFQYSSNGFYVLKSKPIKHMMGVTKKNCLCIFMAIAKMKESLIVLGVQLCLDKFTTCRKNISLCKILNFELK